MSRDVITVGSTIRIPLLYRGEYSQWCERLMNYLEEQTDGEEPEQAPPLPDYIPGPEHADDEIVAEDQPYAEEASPVAQSPEYVPESDFEAHPEDDDDEDPEEEPVDYPADGGDDEEESSEDEEDDEMDVEADEEEEEHPAPADPVVVAPTAADQAPSAEETKPFEIDESAATPPPHLAYRTTARISIPALVPMPAWTDSEVVRLLAISSPPASPLSPWSSPPPQIPFPPLPQILSPPSPVLSPSPPHSPIQFETRVRQDTDEIYMRDRRAHAYTRQLMETEARMSREAWVRATDASDLVHGEVMSLRTTVLGQMSEIRELQAADRRRQTVISELLRIDHRRSTNISELRTALQGQILELRTALQGQVTALQGQVTALQSHVTTLQGQQGLAGDHIQLELPEEAGGSI
nr:hypothetical protein [Tanacetum cinerariifolium]